MINYKDTFIAIAIVISYNSVGQIIIDPIDIPYFVVERESPYVNLPKSLGGKDVKGFAGITITLSSTGKIVYIELEKLKLLGKTNLSYQLGHNTKNDSIIRYENFLKTCVSQLKIIKTDKRKPPLNTRITFLIRFR